MGNNDTLELIAGILMMCASAIIFAFALRGSVRLQKRTYQSIRERHPVDIPGVTRKQSGRSGIALAGLTLFNLGTASEFSLRNTWMALAKSVVFFLPLMVICAISIHQAVKSNKKLEKEE